jgi:hypothetical protein
MPGRLQIVTGYPIGFPGLSRAAGSIESDIPGAFPADDPPRSFVGAPVYLKCGRQHIGVHALLIAIAIQGLTQCTHTVISRWAPRSLDPFTSAGAADIDYGTIPEKDRPTPSDDSDENEAPDEFVISGESCTRIILSLRPATPAGRRAWPNVRRAPFRFTGLNGRVTLLSERISTLCRLIC